MPITDYTELQAAVAGWLNRKDDAELVPRIPEFISLGEAAINRKLRVRDQETSQLLIQASPAVPLPAGYLQTKNVAFESNLEDEIPYVTPQAFLHLRSRYGPTGKPRHYTLDGQLMRFVPSPDATYNLIHSYYQAVPPLSTTNPTNWLLTKHPDFYLTAALYYANEYLRDEDGMRIAAARVDDIYEALRVQNEIDKTSTTPVMRAVPIG